MGKNGFESILCSFSYSAIRGKIRGKLKKKMEEKDRKAGLKFNYSLFF
jgi:hypothetical protein